jgi:hypothetical protein
MQEKNVYSIRYFQNLGTDLKRKLAEWSTNVDALRKSTPLINYFTISQCMQLVNNLSYRRDPDVDFVTNLLRTIDPSITGGLVDSYLDTLDIPVCFYPFFFNNYYWYFILFYVSLVFLIVFIF